MENVYLKEIEYLGKLRKIYTFSKNKIKNVLSAKFLGEIGIRIILERSWGILNPKGDDDFGSPCPFVSFLDRQIFFLISEEKDSSGNPKYVWNGRFFEGLDRETYLEFQKRCFDAFVARSIDFYKSHGNTFYPLDWEDPKTNDLANLRGDLREYLVN